MKKNFLKSLLAFLILPALLLCGCKSNSVSSINVATYFKDSINVTRYDISQNSTESISLLTQSRAKTSNLSKYTKFELTGNGIWLYKMYIETISFYVYCNESSNFQMTINLKMTDLADESTILKATEETVSTQTIEQQCTIRPKKKKAIKCVFKIDKTVANALGATLSIDILNSLELFSGDEEEGSSFMWLIYGLKINGESRTYTR